MDLLPKARQALHWKYVWQPKWTFEVNILEITPGRKYWARIAPPFPHLSKKDRSTMIKGDMGSPERPWNSLENEVSTILLGDVCFQGIYSLCIANSGISISYSCCVSEDWLKGRPEHDIKLLRPKHDYFVRVVTLNYTCPGRDVKMPRPSYDVKPPRPRHDVKLPRLGIYLYIYVKCT